MLDTLPEIIAAGVFALAMVWLILRFASRGGRVKTAVAEIGGGTPSADTAAIMAKLEAMDAERAAAQGLAAGREKLNQAQWRRNFGILGGIVTALHDSGIGNGNLKEAKRLLAECEEARDEALVDQIGGGS